MGVLSGATGQVDSTSAVKNWNINETSTPARYVNSGSGGGTGSIKGVRDWAGSFVANGGQPIVMPGELFEFKGMTGLDTTTGPTYTGNAIVDSINVVWDFATAAALEHTVNFSADGPLAEAEETVVAPTPSEPATVCGLKVGYDGTLLDNVTTINLTITAANVAYTNSATSCEVRRKPGPLDYTLDFGVEEASLLVLPSIDSNVDWYVEIAPSEAWRFSGNMIQNHSGLTVDIETGAIVNLTLNTIMDAIVAGALGYIALPSDADTELAVWWGTPGTEIAVPV